MFKIRNGRHCKFWLDCWAQNVPLKIACENVFKMVGNTGCSLANCWDGDSWVMDFKRSLSEQEYNSWLELGESLQECYPQSDEADAVLWALEPKN